MYLHELLLEDEDEAEDTSQFAGGGMSSPYYDPEEDNSAIKMSDTRKSRLTLRHINKLRTMNELRAVEMNQKLEKVRAQYGAKPESEEGGPGL